MMTQGSYAYPEDDDYRFSQDARYYGPAGGAGRSGASGDWRSHGGSSGAYSTQPRHGGY